MLTSSHWFSVLLILPEDEFDSQRQADMKEIVESAAFILEIGWVSEFAGKKGKRAPSNFVVSFPHPQKSGIGCFAAPPWLRDTC